MEPFILTAPAGAGRTEEESRPGEEMLFGLEGRLHLHIGEEAVELGEADCIYFNRSIPRYGVSEDGGEVVALVVRWTPDRSEKNAEIDRALKEPARGQ